MGGPGLPRQMVKVLGREQECAVIDRLLADARGGAAGALVVCGEPGIGKSALLGYARQHAPPMLVLSASGAQAESDLAFAGLHELLRPVISHLSELPGSQAQALTAALGLAPSARPDRLLIGAAVLGLLAAAAETKPTLCLVDDTHWLDRPSSDALVFTARRLRAEQLAILVGARAGEASRFEGAGLPELTLAGLDQRSAAHILAARARQASPSVRDRLLTEADGNPLALLELPSGLSEEQLQGLVPLPDAIPLTPRLEGLFRQRIGQLPEATQIVLLIAAIDNTEDVAAVLRAAAALQLPTDALDPAQQAGLVQITGTVITFRHPLVRSALYQAATLNRRRRVPCTATRTPTAGSGIRRWPPSPAMRRSLRPWKPPPAARRYAQATPPRPPRSSGRPSLAPTKPVVSGGSPRPRTPPGRPGSPIGPANSSDGRCRWPTAKPAPGCCTSAGSSRISAAESGRRAPSSFKASRNASTRRESWKC